MRPSFDVLKGGFVGRNHAGTGTCLNRHIADGHAPFHRQRTDGRATVFKYVALTAPGSDLGNHGQNNVLSSHPRFEGAFNVNGHGFKTRQRQGLGGHHVLNLRGADTKGQRSESTVG